MRNRGCCNEQAPTAGTSRVEMTDVLVVGVVSAFWAGLILAGIWLRGQHRDRSSRRP